MSEVYFIVLDEAPFFSQADEFIYDTHKYDLVRGNHEDCIGVTIASSENMIALLEFAPNDKPVYYCHLSRTEGFEGHYLLRQAGESSLAACRRRVASAVLSIARYKQAEDLQDVALQEVFEESYYSYAPGM